MLNKLEKMINEKENNIVVNAFNDLGEEVLHLANLACMFATVTYNEEEKGIEIDIEEYDCYSGEYILLASKRYKTVKGAYNFINKMLP